MQIQIEQYQKEESYKEKYENERAKNESLKKKLDEANLQNGLLNFWYLLVGMNVSTFFNAHVLFHKLWDIIKNGSFSRKYKGFYMVNVHYVGIPYL